MRSRAAKHVCEILNSFLLLKSFLHYSLKKKKTIVIVLSFAFPSSGSLYLGILGFKSELNFSTLDFCIFNLRQPSRFVYLVYTPRSSLIHGTQNCREKKKLNGS